MSAVFGFKGWGAVIRGSEEKQLCRIFRLEILTMGFSELRGADREREARRDQGESEAIIIYRNQMREIHKCDTKLHCTMESLDLHPRHLLASRLCWVHSLGNVVQRVQTGRAKHV